MTERRNLGTMIARNGKLMDFAGSMHEVGEIIHSWPAFNDHGDYHFIARMNYGAVRAFSTECGHAIPMEKTAGERRIALAGL